MLRESKPLVERGIKSNLLGVDIAGQRGGRGGGYVADHPSVYPGEIVPIKRIAEAMRRSSDVLEEVRIR